MNASDTAFWTASTPAFTAGGEPATVHKARSQPRDSETGEMCFDISYGGGVSTRVPIRAFMDLDDHSFEHKEVTNAVNDWVAVAIASPYACRKCICCRRRALYSRVLCRGCWPVYGETVYAPDDQ